MTDGRGAALRAARTVLGWVLLASFVAMVVVWTVDGFDPGLVARWPEPFAAYGRPAEWWPILAAFVAGVGAAWVLGPVSHVGRGGEAEGGANVAPFAAGMLGLSAVVMAFGAYWPCGGDEAPVWAALRRTLEIFHGSVAEPFGTVPGCPAELPPGLQAATIFASIGVALALGVVAARLFQQAGGRIRAFVAPQVVVFCGLTEETVEAARAVRRGLTRRQRLLLLEAGPQEARARTLAREIGALVLLLDVTDDEAVRAFMRGRGRRVIRGLYLMSSESSENLRALRSFLPEAVGTAGLGRTSDAADHAEDRVRGLAYAGQGERRARADLQRQLLMDSHDRLAPGAARRWRAKRSRSGVLSRRRAFVTEVPGRVVVRVDNPWQAADWRRRQMIERRGWLVDAVSAHEIAARHVVGLLKDEGIAAVVVVGQTPFELAILSELAFERRVDDVLSAASDEGLARCASQGARDAFRRYEARTPRAVLIGEVADETAAHFHDQLARFGVEKAEDGFVVERRTVEEFMADDPADVALVLTHTPDRDATFLAVRHPRWRILEWVPTERGVTPETLLGGLSVIGPTLEPAPGYGLDIWERLGRVQHQAYLLSWRGGVVAAGDPARGDWDDDLDAFTRASNVRAFATFCRVVGELGTARTWATDLGAGGGQQAAALNDEELEVAALREHDSWVRHHIESGWRLGDVRRQQPAAGGGLRRGRRRRAGREASRLHPDLVEWEALDERERDKDRDSVRGVLRLLDALGFTLVRA